MGEPAFRRNAAGELRIGTGASLASLRALDAQSVTVLFGESSVAVRVTFEDRPEVFVSSPEGVQHALAIAVEWSSNGRLSIADAALRRRVRLPEGGVGILTFLDKAHVMARVITPEGRTRTLPAALLSLIPEEIS